MRGSVILCNFVGEAALQCLAQHQQRQNYNTGPALKHNRVETGFDWYEFGKLAKATHDG
jgi:hypothetical protein